MTDGVSSFSNSYNYVEYGTSGIDAGATTLGTVDGYPAVVVKEVGAGRGVSLSPVYGQYNWGTGMADRLLEQAVAWAAFGGADTEDNYLVSATQGDVLHITTTTPGDGANQPANNLDARIDRAGEQDRVDDVRQDAQPAPAGQRPLGQHAQPAQQEAHAAGQHAGHMQMLERQVDHGAGAVAMRSSWRR